MTLRLLILLALATPTLLAAQQQVPTNVELHREGQEPKGYAPCEPSIAIDPTNPDRIVAGAVLDYVYVSEDAGKSWSRDRLTSKLGFLVTLALWQGRKATSIMPT